MAGSAYALLTDGSPHGTGPRAAPDLVRGEGAPPAQSEAAKPHGEAQGIKRHPVPPARDTPREGRTQPRQPRASARKFGKSN